jgi:hypothetical protein
MGADEALFLPAAFPPAAPLARLMRTNTPRLAPMQPSLTLSSLAVQAPVLHLPVPDTRVRAESYERNVLWQRQFRAVRKFLGSFRAHESAAERSSGEHANRSSPRQRGRVPLLTASI